MRWRKGPFPRRWNKADTPYLRREICLPARHISKRVSYSHPWPNYKPGYKVWRGDDHHSHQRRIRSFGRWLQNVSNETKQCISLCALPFRSRHCVEIAQTVWSLRSIEMDGWYACFIVGDKRSWRILYVFVAVIVRLPGRSFLNDLLL